MKHLALLRLYLHNGLLNTWDIYLIAQEHLWYLFQWLLSQSTNSLFACHFHALWKWAVIYSTTVPQSLNTVCSTWFSCHLMGLYPEGHTQTFKARLTLHTNDELIPLHANLALIKGQSVLTCCRLNHVRFAVHFLDDGVHLDDVGDPRRQPGDEVRDFLARNSNLWWDKCRTWSKIFSVFLVWHLLVCYLLQSTLIIFGMIGQNVILCPKNRLPFNQERDVSQPNQTQSLRAEDW